MSETKFYICEQLVPGTVEASTEKHIPVASVEGSMVNVTVGAVEHPMTEEHFIQWVYLKTTSGGQRKTLTPGSAPAVSFALTGDDKPLAVYAYCNLHGLWMSEL